MQCCIFHSQNNDAVLRSVHRTKKWFCGALTTKHTTAKNRYLIAIQDSGGSILAILGAIRAIGSYPIAIRPDSGSYPWIASYLSSYLSSYPG